MYFFSPKPDPEPPRRYTLPGARAGTMRSSWRRSRSCSNKLRLRVPAFYIPSRRPRWHVGDSLVSRSNSPLVRVCPNPPVVRTFLVSGDNMSETSMLGVPRRAMSDGKIFDICISDRHKKSHDDGETCLGDEHEETLQNFSSSPPPLPTSEGHMP